MLTQLLFHKKDAITNSSVSAHILCGAMSNLRAVATSGKPLDFTEIIYPGTLAVKCNRGVTQMAVHPPCPPHPPI